MKFRVATPNGDLIKGDCKLKIGDTDIDLKEFDIPGDDKTSNCYLLTSPGDILTPHLAISLTHQAEEFVDVVVDGILRASSGIKKGGKAKNFTNHVNFDKVLSYTFKGDKRKALVANQMLVQTRDTSKDVDADEDLPTSSVGTIEFQLWRKYPEAESSTTDGSSEILAAVKRATPLSEEHARWFDLNCRVSKEPIPPSFEIGFTGEPKLSKTLKDKIKEDRPGFTLYHIVKFHLASTADLRKLGFVDVPLHYANTSQTAAEEADDPVEPQEISNMSDAENDDTDDGSMLEAASESSESKRPNALDPLVKPPPQMKTICSLLEDLSKKAEKETKPKGKTSAKSEGPEELETPSSSQLSDTPSKHKSKADLAAEEANKLLSRFDKYKPSSSAQKGTPAKETSTKKKKATVLQGVKGAPAHKSWLEREATQVQESLPTTDTPLTQSPPLPTAVSFPDRLPTQEFDAAISELARQKRSATVESETPKKQGLATDTERSLLTPRPDGAAPVVIMTEFQTSTFPDSQLSTQSYNNTQEKLEAEALKARNDEDMTGGQVRASSPEQTVPLLTSSTSSDAPTEVVEEMSLITPEDLPGTPNTGGGCTSPIMFPAFSLPPSIEDLDNEQTPVIILGLGMQHTASNRHISSTTSRTPLPSARSRSSSITSLPFDSSPQYTPMTQGIDLSSPPQKCPDNPVTPEKQKEKIASARSALKTPGSGSSQEVTPTKVSKSVRFTASTKSSFTSTTSGRIRDPFVLSPPPSQASDSGNSQLLTPGREKRKAEVSYGAPRKLSTSPGLKNSDDIARRTAEAHARIAAAQKKKQELEKETQAAEAFAAEREKVQLLEEQAAELERENAELQATIEALYGGCLE